MELRLSNLHCAFILIFQILHALFIDVADFDIRERVGIG